VENVPDEIAMISTDYGVTSGKYKYYYYYTASL